ncbi:MAG: hypothetical protein N3A69_12865 [Leptospiraceae bacterium]|nr:hypothetical protein [Leptospiraceae bacterium]
MTPNEILQEIYETIDWHEQLGLVKRACCLRFIYNVLLKTKKRILEDMGER